VAARMFSESLFPGKDNDQPAARPARSAFNFLACDDASGTDRFEKLCSVGLPGVLTNRTGKSVRPCDSRVAAHMPTLLRSQPGG
jgi:hypothetical protein